MRDDATAGDNQPQTTIASRKAERTQRGKYVERAQDNWTHGGRISCKGLMQEEKHTTVCLLYSQYFLQHYLIPDTIYVGFPHMKDSATRAGHSTI